MRNHITRPLHTGISVLDMDEAIQWYEKKLGFHVVKNCGFLSPLEAKVVFLEYNGYQIELVEYQHPQPLPPERWEPNTDLRTVGTKHLAFETDDMTALKTHFAANGVDIVLECRMDGEAVMFVRDPNGVLLEFIQPTV